MNQLNSKYKQILWANVVILGAGVGYLVFKKWGNVGYAVGAVAAIGTLEYAVMYFSLLRKQRKEEERK
ncbi:MAG: hypothetical protein COA91_12160 [Robiginitomaculum sp.]|nr:MAG: hypothetical protein COA91_12160 [Robiginitomaculum sp.]